MDNDYGFRCIKSDGRVWVVVLECSARAIGKCFTAWCAITQQNIFQHNAPHRKTTQASKKLVCQTNFPIFVKTKIFLPILRNDKSITSMIIFIGPKGSFFVNVVLRTTLKHLLAFVSESNVVHTTTLKIQQRLSVKIQREQTEQQKTLGKHQLNVRFTAALV